MIVGDANNDRVPKPLGAHGKEQHGKLGEWRAVWNIWDKHGGGGGVETGNGRQIRGTWMLN